MKILKNSIEKGLEFLKNEYKQDKFFGFEALFPTILVADCLNQIKEARELNKNLIKNILLEKSDFFSFNYWYKGTNKYKIEPYPDDLDDTFCALSAIFRFDKKLIKGGDLAKIINLLVLCEENEGGPYRTWIVPKKESKRWDDVDVAVNSNVAYFLRLQDIELENINSLVENHINANNLNSPFYKGDLPIIYFISRFYSGKYKVKLVENLLLKIDKKSSSLELALIVSSLIRLNYKENIKDIWIKTLLKRQNDKGAWEADDFYFYVNKDSKTNFIGSQSMTTAFVLEALSLWNKSVKDGLKKNGLNLIKQKIYDAAWENLTYLPDSIRSPVLNFLKVTFENDKNGIITLTPIMTCLSLRKELQKNISEDFLIKLGMINLYGWCAYTIYDDIMDGDSDVKNLNLANVFNREMEILFNNLEIDRSTGFFEFYKQVMQGVENANFWELNNLIYDKKNIDGKKLNTDDLSNKSLGHALTSVAILCKLGFSIESEEIQNMINFFKNYLISKQMNDDIHDWEKDLKKGRINSASVELLNLSEKNETENQQVLFWKKVVPLYCKKIVNYCKNAEVSAKSINIFKNKRFFIGLINKNNNIAKRTLEERKKTLDFIDNYC